MTYEKRTMSVLIAMAGETIFSEGATTVSIDDETGGEFVVVSQEGTPGYGKIAINPEEWHVIRSVIDDMIKDCRQ